MLNLISAALQILVARSQAVNDYARDCHNHGFSIALSMSITPRYSLGNVTTVHRFLILDGSDSNMADRFNRFEGELRKREQTTYHEHTKCHLGPIKGVKNLF